MKLFTYIVKTFYLLLISILHFLFITFFSIGFILIYNILFNIKIIFFIYSTRSIGYGMQYDYIKIENKLFNKNLPILILIIEFIKILIFILSYDFFKNHNSNNIHIYILCIFNFFTIPIKIIYLISIAFLNYKFNKNIKTYLLNIIEIFLYYFNDLKIEFSHGFIYFNFANWLKTFLPCHLNLKKIVLMHPKLISPHITNFIDNKYREMSKDFPNEINPNKDWYHVIDNDKKLSQVPHYGEVNHFGTFLCTHTSNIINSKLQKSFIKTYPYVKDFINNNNNFNSKTGGIVLTKKQENMIFFKTKTFAHEGNGVFELQKNLAILKVNKKDLEESKLFDFEKLDRLEKNCDEISMYLKESGVFEEDSSENVNNKAEQITKIMVTHRFCIDFANESPSNNWEIVLKTLNSNNT